jgi:NifB/MoaA-like Fe-S oxidoreductase
LTHSDLVHHLQGRDLGDELIISDVMLKPHTDMTLDGKHVPDIAEALGVKVTAVENTARGLIAGALGEAMPQLSTRAFSTMYEPNIPDFH